MVLAFLLFSLLATSSGVPLTPNALHPMNTVNIDDHSSVQVFGRELPECLKLGSYCTTSQILWSCLATIFACTWVAIHPNLPGPRDTSFQRFWRRVTYAIFAIIAPELIAIFATMQRVAANEIKNTFNEKFHDGDDELWCCDPLISCCMDPFYLIKEWFACPPDEVKGTWTLTHGFFVQMGGFMMYHEGKPVQVLTFDRLLKAIDRGEIDVPHIPEDEITCRSRGDGLSKLVVVLQTTWFVAQCFGRWHSHLPLTELEVSTLAFAVLNAYIYALWWSKPQGVLVPIKLEFKVPPSSSNKSPSPSETDRHSVSKQPSSSQLPPPYPKSPVTSASPLSDAESALPVTPHKHSDQDEEGKKPLIEVDFDKESSYWIRGKFKRVQVPSGSSPLKRISAYFSYLSIIFYIILWYPIRMVGKTVNTTHSKRPEGDYQKEFVVGKSRVPMFYADNTEIHGLLLFSVIVIPSIFGGIHITLWSALFPTSLEQLLWRISAVYITVAPFLPSLLAVIVFILEFLDIDPDINGDIMVYLGVLVAFIYPVARGILIFISFHTLRHLPEGAYHDVQWSTLLPHV